MLVLLVCLDCKGKGGATPSSDGGGAGEAGLALCPVDEDGGQAGLDGAGAGELVGAVDAGLGPSQSDEFGPNGVASKTAASLGRVNLYEVTTPRLLQRFEIYLRAALPDTRLTLAVYESTGRDTAFKRIFDVQIAFGTCEGWASSGPLAIPLLPGRFYAMGYDPNQAVTPSVIADGDVLPSDGAFGRLVGSKTSTSVSLDTLPWDRSTDKEYNRQRLLTASRPVDDASDDAATTDGGLADGGLKDGGRG